MKEKKESPALASALAALRKKYKDEPGGENIVVNSDDVPDVESIPSGCFALDRLLGCGGIPKGRLIEVYGQEGSGKSTLCLFLASQVQKMGGRCVFVDAENAFDANYASAIGVNVSELIVSQPGTLEQAMDVVREFVETKEIDLIIVDSVAALTPKSELEGEEMLKDSMAVQARLLGKAFRILTGPISRSKTIVIFINQVREKVGVVYGVKETTPGGKALKFFSSVRLSVSKGEKLLKGTVQVGNTVKVKAAKNKVGFPWKECTFDLYYGSGVDLVMDTLDTAVELGVIKKSGSTFTYDGNTLGVGREKARDALEKDNATLEAIRKQVKDLISPEGSRTK